MSGNRINILVHVVWNTRDREPTLDAQMQQWLWPALAEKARELGCKRVVVGGVDDHVHVLVDLPATLDIATLVQRLRGASSRAANLLAGTGALRCVGSPPMPRSRFAWTSSPKWQTTYNNKPSDTSDTTLTKAWNRHRHSKRHAPGTLRIDDRRALSSRIDEIPIVVCAWPTRPP